MSSPPNVTDDSNPFSSDPSPFSSSPSPTTDDQLPSSSSTDQLPRDNDDDDDAPLQATSAYPFSADPYAQHARQESAGEDGEGEGEDGERVTMNNATSPPLPLTPRERERERSESWKKTTDDVIQIVDALKTSEGASAPYIVYCIRYEGREVRRRYSDFVSLRAALATLHPCFVVPPLPPKNTLSSYAIAGTNPSKAKEDVALIARRRRMLSTFLNRTHSHKVLGSDRVFQRFLDPETPWLDVLHSPPVTLVPKNPLRAAASDPTDPDLLALFANLPLPTSSSASLQHPDQRFLDSESFTNKFSSHLSGNMEKVNKRLMKRWTDAAGDWSEMGGGMNGFALRMGEEDGGNGGLDEATEKVGMAVDAGYTLTNSMLSRWEQEWTEPLQEYTQFSSIIKTLLKYRHQKHLQYESARELLESKRSTLEELERSELEAQRLAKALERVRVVGDDGSTQGAMEGSETTAGTEGQHQPLPPLPPTSPTGGRKSGGGLLSALSHSVKGFVDSDPEASRRNTISKTREQINQLDDAIKALTSDLRWASSTIQADLDRFQRQKVGDLREMCLDFSTFHKEWAEKNLAMWEEAAQAIDAISVD
ncbi:PX and BAR domain-containing protein [Sporobolomyces salmoneus]|uniref:PX and BAR domain-containing protein n=1 Tax=Sporobolomyces salmoneus TaxID=183962 RepID=UPI003182AB88